MEFKTERDLVEYVAKQLEDMKPEELSDNLDNLTDEAVRIVDERGGTGHLDSDVLVVASIVVTVCAIVLQLMRLFGDNKARPPKKKEVLDELEKQSGETNIQQDIKVEVVVKVAIEAMSKNTSEKSNE